MGKGAAEEDNGAFQVKDYVTACIQSDVKGYADISTALCFFLLFSSSVWLTKTVGCLFNNRVGRGT